MRSTYINKELSTLWASDWGEINTRKREGLRNSHILGRSYRRSLWSYWSWNRSRMDISWSYWYLRNCAVGQASFSLSNTITPRLWQLLLFCAKEAGYGWKMQQYRQIRWRRWLAFCIWICSKSHARIYLVTPLLCRLWNISAIWIFYLGYKKTSHMGTLGYVYAA